MTDDERAIRELVATWMSASKAGDTETVLSLMTDDVIFLLPGQLPMRGKAAFAAASGGPRPFAIDGVSEVQEVRVCGELGYVWTKLSIVVTPREGDVPAERSGYTLSVMRKEGGRWLLARDANLLTVVA